MTTRFRLLKKVLSWILGIVVFLALWGWLLLFPPLPRPPEIARGLPNSFAAADAEFARRIDAEFGSVRTTDELIARLSEQGFTVYQERNFAIFSKFRFFCDLIWRINWEAEDGLVSNLRSRYGGSCL